jgi:hypothetical protein
MDSWAPEAVGPASAAAACGVGERRWWTCECSGSCGGAMRWCGGGDIAVATLGRGAGVGRGEARGGGAGVGRRRPWGADIGEGRRRREGLRRRGETAARGGSESRKMSRAGVHRGYK